MCHTENLLCVLTEKAVREDHELLDSMTDSKPTPVSTDWASYQLLRALNCLTGEMR